MNSMTNISLSDFNVHFKENPLFIDDLTWSSENCLNLISGYNGSGKTILLKSLSKLSPTIFDSHSIKGNFILNGVNQLINNKYKAQLISYLPQANDIINIGSTVYNELSILSNRINIDFDRYLKALETLGFKYDLNELKNRPTSTFSRGEKQKLGLAFIEALNPNCIFYDEPDSFLDKNGQNGLVNLVKQQLKEDKVVFIASHRKNIYESIKHSTLCLSPDEIEDPIEVVKSKNLSKSLILKLAKQEVHISKSSSFHIPEISFFEGEIIKVEGKNGTGKSTLLKKIFHNDISSQLYISQKEMIFITEEPDNQILYKNLEFEINTFLKGNHHFNDDFIIQSLTIFENKKLNIHTLSWGQRKYLLLLLSIASSAKLLFLDEPFTGINGTLRIALCGLFDFALTKGKTIIFSSNDSESLDFIEFDKHILL